jgi:predicted nucleic acid-binding protein
LALADACTLQNFAVVGALWILERRYGSDLTWTEAVRHEIRRGLPAEPRLQRVLDLEDAWLGSPLRLDQPGDDEVDLIRRGLGGLAARPLEHLGEAESIRALERSNATDRLLLTDNGPASDFASRRSSGIRVLDSADVLTEAYAMGDIGCPQAYDILRAMHGEGRAIRLPPHREVC